MDAVVLGPAVVNAGRFRCAASIGMINMVGNLGGFIGPYLIGFLLTRGYSYSLAAQLMAAGFIVAAALTFALKIAYPAHQGLGRSK